MHFFYRSKKTLFGKNINLFILKKILQSLIFKIFEDSITKIITLWTYKIGTESIYFLKEKMENYAFNGSKDN